MRTRGGAALVGWNVWAKLAGRQPNRINGQRGAVVGTVTELEWSVGMMGLCWIHDTETFLDFRYWRVSTWTCVKYIEDYLRIIHLRQAKFVVMLRPIG